MVEAARQQGVRDDGFAEFYVATKDRCLRAAIAAGMSAVAAEDAVAEAYARAFASWTKVRDLDAPVAWVMRTAVNQDISWWRRRRREIARSGPLDPVVSGGVPPAQNDTAAGVLDAIAAIQRLPARQREVVVLRYLLDLDTATTASVLSIAPGTVTAHLHRALAALRSDLSEPRPPPAPRGQHALTGELRPRVSTSPMGDRSERQEPR